HCPLCDAIRSVGEFEAGLDNARARLAGRAERLRSALEALDTANAAVSAANQLVERLGARVQDLSTSRARLLEELSLIERAYADANFEAAPDRPLDAQRLLLTRQERLARVERALFVLE